MNPTQILAPWARSRVSHPPVFQAPNFQYQISNSRYPKGEVWRGWVFFTEGFLKEVGRGCVAKCMKFAPSILGPNLGQNSPARATFRKMVLALGYHSLFSLSKRFRTRTFRSRDSFFGLSTRRGPSLQTGIRKACRFYSLDINLCEMFS